MTMNYRTIQEAFIPITLSSLAAGVIAYSKSKSFK